MSNSTLEPGSGRKPGRSDETPSSEGWQAWHIVAAAAIGLLLLLLVVLVAYVYIRKWLKKRGSTTTDTEDGRSNATNASGATIQGIMQHHRVKSVSRFGQAAATDGTAAGNATAAHTPHTAAGIAKTGPKKVESDTGSLYFRQLANLKGVKSVSEYQKK